MKIYTKTGDKGTTSLFTGERVSKTSPFIEALGAVDEANSCLGLALSLLPKEEFFQRIRGQLEIIQHALFDVGAALATPRRNCTPHKLKKTLFEKDATDILEKWLDEMDGSLPPLKKFILPGGHPAGAALHLARSIVRRAERDVLPLYEQQDVSQDVLIYLNRLSDYLFMAARFLNFHLKVSEMLWRPHLGGSK